MWCITQLSPGPIKTKIPIAVRRLTGLLENQADHHITAEAEPWYHGGIRQDSGQSINIGSYTIKEHVL